MFNNNPFNKRPEDGLKIVSRCPVCQADHNPNETAILDENDGAHLIYIKCRNCQSGVVAIVSLNAMGVTSVGLVTDLNSQEVVNFKDFSIVNEADVLNMHAFLQKPKITQL